MNAVTTLRPCPPWCSEHVEHGRADGDPHEDGEVREHRHLVLATSGLRVSLTAWFGRESDGTRWQDTAELELDDVDGHSIFIPAELAEQLAAALSEIAPTLR